MVRDGVLLYRYPGTSYLATIMLSLRDKTHPPAEALIELALMGNQPVLVVQPKPDFALPRMKRGIYSVWQWSLPSPVWQEKTVL
jgi:hypothetical protein